MPLPPTPHMSLALPEVGVTPAPDWANLLNTAINTIDLHNHTPGYGKRVPVAGIEIDAHLDFNNFGITELWYASFEPVVNPQPATDVPNSSLYSTGTDLFYKDSAGSSVNISASAGGSGAGFFGDYEDEDPDGGIASYTGGISNLYRLSNNDGGVLALSNVVSRGLSNDAGVTAGQEALTITSVEDIEITAADNINIKSGTGVSKNIKLIPGSHNSAVYIKNDVSEGATVSSFFIDGPSQTTDFHTTPATNENSSRVSIFAYDTAVNNRAGINFHGMAGGGEAQIRLTNSSRLDTPGGDDTAASSLRIGDKNWALSGPIFIAGRCNAAFIAGAPNTGNEDTYKPAIQLEYNWNRGGIDSSGTSGSTPDNMVVIQGRGTNSQADEDTWGQLLLHSSGAKSTAAPWPSDLGPDRGHLQLIAMSHGWISPNHIHAFGGNPAGELLEHPGIIHAFEGELHLMSKGGGGAGVVSVSTGNEFIAGRTSLFGMLDVFSASGTGDSYLGVGVGAELSSTASNINIESGPSAVIKLQTPTTRLSYNIQASHGSGNALVSVGELRHTSGNALIQLHAVGNAGGATTPGASLVCYHVTGDVALENASVSGSVFLKTNSALAVEVKSNGHVNTYGEGLWVGKDTASTGAVSIELAPGRTQHGITYIDFTSEALESDYNARIIRQPNVNGDFEIINTGTGDLLLNNSSGEFKATAASMDLNISGPINVSGTTANYSIGSAVLWTCVDGFSIDAGDTGTFDYVGEFTLQTADTLTLRSTSTGASDFVLSAAGGIKTYTGSTLRETFMDDGTVLKNIKQREETLTGNWYVEPDTGGEISVQSGDLILRAPGSQITMDATGAVTPEDSIVVTMDDALGAVRPSAAGEAQIGTETYPFHKINANEFLPNIDGDNDAAYKSPPPMTYRMYPHSGGIIEPTSVGNPATKVTGTCFNVHSVTNPSTGLYLVTIDYGTSIERPVVVTAIHSPTENTVFASYLWNSAPSNSPPPYREFWVNIKDEDGAFVNVPFSFIVFGG